MAGDQRTQGKIIKFLNNPWIVTTGSGLLILFAGYIIGNIINIKVFFYFKNIFNIFFSFVLKVSNYKIPLWSVGLLLIGLLLFLFILFIFAIQKKKKYEQRYLIYTEDIIKEYKWKWEYRNNKIINLRNICINCGCELTRKPNPIHFTLPDIQICPNCENEYKTPSKSLKEATEIIIAHRVNTGTYENHN